MTSPDAPLAQVRTIGPSEIATAVGLVSSLLVAVFGHDWGLSGQAQNIATVGVIVLPLFLKWFRGMQHIAVAQANSAVVVAQIQAGSAPAPKPSPPAVQLTPDGSVPLEHTGPKRRPRGVPGGGQFYAEAPTRTTGE